MHELAATKSLMGIAEMECLKNNIKNPKKIHVELGAFTTYKKNQIEYYFEILKKQNTLLFSANLLVEEIPIKIRCAECKKESIIEGGNVFFCPLCNSASIEIIQGKDLYIKSIFF